MTFQRGDVVLIPFPYTDLSATKTRPAVIVSSQVYHLARPELLLAYISSQVAKADPQIDHVLVDWKAAGLLSPSFVRPKLATIEPYLIIRQVGTLSTQDMLAVDRCLRRAMGLIETVLTDVITELDLMSQPPTTVQALAEKVVLSIVSLAAAKNPEVDVERLRQLLAV